MVLCSKVHLHSEALHMYLERGHGPPKPLKHPPKSVHHIRVV